MNIIIVGCGRVGYILGEHLSREHHNITLVDNDEAKLQPATANLDVQVVVGNGTTLSTLMEAGVKDANLLVAVTSEDEVNMVSCMIAKKANADCQTIARIRKPEYLPERNFFKSALQMSMIINPELAAAKEIFNLINVPAALEVDAFAKGRIELLRVLVEDTSVLCGMKIYEVSKKFDRKVLVCIVQHNGEVFIPNGNTELCAKDIISIILPKTYIPTFYNSVSNTSLKSVKNVMIAGGGVTAFYLAEMLTDSGIRVKILEENEKRCLELSVSLPKAEIIHADAENRDVLLENGLESMDAFVSLTTVDEENIFLSLYANKVSPECKLITRVQKLQKDEIINALPLGSIITPRELTVEYILQHIRASKNTKGSNIEALYELLDGKVEALEFSIKDNSPVINTPLSEMKLKTGLLLCSIVRSNKLITPSGKDVLMVGDTVIVVTTQKGINDISDILA